MSENDDNTKIVCMIDGQQTHIISRYLKTNHPEWTVDAYKEKWPDAPLISEFAKKELARRRELAANATKTLETSQDGMTPAIKSAAFHELFGMGAVKGALNARGEPIMLEIRQDLSPEAAMMVPEVKDAYVFDIDMTKEVIAGLRMNMAMYFWGMHGTGKTSVFTQTAARLNRPFMRVQHTVNTEEAHIIGQWIVKDGSTEFQLGPLPTAMLNGYIYCADEYDFAMPSVTSVYQAVLEGEPLMIKEAPPELRVIRPHRDFRFCATGNTNGGGDDTGFYQGTQVQNAANYSRFGIVREVGYMEPKVETLIVATSAQIDAADASKIVKFCNDVRTAAKTGSISATISPREAIALGRIGAAFTRDWRRGVRLAFTNRLSRIDRETVETYAQRVFG